jgi:hypothetical protein
VAARAVSPWQDSLLTAREQLSAAGSQQGDPWVVLAADTVGKGATAQDLLPEIRLAGERPQVYATAAVYGLLKMISLAGFPALIPLLVGADQQTAANALESAGFGAAIVAGPALAGVALGLGLPPAAVIAGDAATYLVFAATLAVPPRRRRLLMRRPVNGRHPVPPSGRLGDLPQGRRRPHLPDGADLAQRPKLAAPLDCRSCALLVPWLYADMPPGSYRCERASWMLIFGVTAGQEWRRMPGGTSCSLCHSSPGTPKLGAAGGLRARWT